MNNQFVVKHEYDFSYQRRKAVRDSQASGTVRIIKYIRGNFKVQVDHGTGWMTYSSHTTLGEARRAVEDMLQWYWREAYP